MAVRRCSSSFLRDLTGEAQPGDRRHVLRAGPTMALLTATDEQRFERRPAAHPEGSSTDRTVELVTAERQIVDVELADVDRHLADCLHRVAQKRYTALAQGRAPPRRPAAACRARCWPA